MTSSTVYLNELAVRRREYWCCDLIQRLMQGACSRNLLDKASGRRESESPRACYKPTDQWDQVQLSSVGEWYYLTGCWAWLREHVWIIRAAPITNAGSLDPVTGVEMNSTNSSCYLDELRTLIRCPLRMSSNMVSAILYHNSSSGNGEGVKLEGIGQ